MTQRAVAIGPVDTPMGAFNAVFAPDGLACMTFPGQLPEACRQWAKRWEPEARIVEDRAQLDDLAGELTEYLEGKRREFNVPLDLRGTPFQVRVWRALLNVGYGEVRTYRQIAVAVGALEAVRAVGAANGANPVPVIVPCHRIIGSDGTLTGYGGGLDMKRRLLEIEGVLAAF